MAANQELLEDLIYCARYGEFEDLKESKAAPELYITKDEDGNTALHMASANNHIDIVNFIIEQLKTLGSEQLTGFVNVRNEQGNTPLHWAALNGHLEVVKVLVTNGADCKIKNVVEKTPIYEAQQRNHEKIAEFFLDTMIEEEAKNDSDEEMDEDEQYVETGVPKKDSMEE
ncbi:ankyrin repeat-containing domain protein [Chlamydoabsidia padenii]|nr:ankyrin repeat-containing domain protein [Chlamydoabsidia padenii]